MPDDRDVGLGLAVFRKRDGALDRDDGPIGQANDEESVQIVDECVVPRAHGRHLDDFAPDQLDVVVALEDTHLAHAVVLLAVEQSSRRRQFDRHRLPPYRVIEQYIARHETLRKVPRRIRS